MDIVKKYLPFILLGAGVLVLVVVFFFIKSRNGGSADLDDTSSLIEISFADRPFAQLTPTSDGHYIILKIDKVKIAKAASMDYELLYSLPDGRTQGVPGTADLKSVNDFEKKLLLGSESSGKFRYDEGVEEGSLTIRFRDSKGKLLAKFQTKFHLQTETDELTNVEGDFTYKLDKESSDYFVTMNTFGLPEEISSEISAGPFGIFSSDSLPSGSATGWQTASSNLFYR